jgi:hypothetical protein
MCLPAVPAGDLIGPAAHLELKPIPWSTIQQ